MIARQIVSVPRLLRISPSCENIVSMDIHQMCDHKESLCDTKQYDHAINALNGLQSNASIIEEISNSKTQTKTYSQRNNVNNTQKYLDRCNINLDKLSGKLIHVSGTKGKGSTCALTESILRSHGFTTGFYSSPHLFSVRERIRINGKPLCYNKFAHYFWKVYNTLINNKEDDNDMPTYFKFLTVMALNIFIEENIDVALIEVGIGGKYDCTNVLRNTNVVGITSLGYDHTNILGETIEEIAWNKGGIMKEGCLAFTCEDQPTEALDVLEKCSHEAKCSLFKIRRNLNQVKDLTPVITLNAALAVKLAHAWIYKKTGCSPFSTDNFTWEDEIQLPDKTLKGLVNCSWPGRFQILRKENITYYLDGAHTSESIHYCTDWFKKNTLANGVKKILVFNVIKRNPEPLLNILKYSSFDKVFFCPNLLSDSFTIPNDLQAKKVSNGENNLRVWESLGESNGELYKSVSEVIRQISTEGETEEVNVLVTGSVHLVGNFLKLLKPDLWD